MTGTNRLWVIPPVLSGALCVLTGVCYALRPDDAALVTLFPAWVWLFPGLGLLAVGWQYPRKRALGVVLLLWVAHLLAFAEEPKSLARGCFRAVLAGESAASGITVVSLNCAGGSTEAMEEVAACKPGLVLLQETPGREEVSRFARRLFGDDAGVAWGVDGSVVARGEVSPVPLPPRVAVNLTLARVRMEAREYVVGSIRLIPPTLEYALWSPACWRAQTEDRRARRAQLREIVPYLEQVPETTPLILGGDFNAPAGDGIFRLLRPRLRDTFREGGVGWGSTALNDFPVVRIDQVWASRHFQTEAVTVHRTQHSDHRMVVCKVRSVACGALPENR